MTTLNDLFTEGPLPPSRHSRTWGRRTTVAALAVGALVVLAGMIFAFTGTSESIDYSGEGSGEVTVVVGRGDSLTTIGKILVDAGVVKSTEAFVDASALNAQSGSIGPGQYTMREQMSSASALSLLLDPASRTDSRLVLREGLRLDQTLDAAAKATGLPKRDFERVIANADQLPLPDWAAAKPEGFMFPATYDLVGDETAQNIIDTLIERFNQSAASIRLEERASIVGKTPYEVMIIASLLEAELVPEDFAKGAAVVYNRLELDMPLQFDSTVSYALGIQELQLSAEQLKVQSPFNTYEVKGLPPNPINSPGEAAIEAAMTPAKGKWLYFVAVNPDTLETKFAKTYDRFLELKQVYREYMESNDN